MAVLWKGLTFPTWVQLSFQHNHGHKMFVCVNPDCTVGNGVSGFWFEQGRFPFYQPPGGDCTAAVQESQEASSCCFAPVMLQCLTQIFPQSHGYSAPGIQVWPQNPYG